jgi:hypothetical protein
MADGMDVSEANWRDGGFGDGGKGKLFVFFYDKQVRHPARSRKAMRPIFVNKVMIKKLVPADPRVVIDTYANIDDFDKFPVEYARYQQKIAAKPDGTPIDSWPLLNDLQKAEFKALNIFTVEQFANLPDAAGNNIMGFIELRRKARGFVIAQEAGEKLIALQEEKAKDDKLKAEQAAVIADLTARLAALEGNKGGGTLHAKAK